MSAANRYQLSDLLYLMARLRDPEGGCPWDLQQDFAITSKSGYAESHMGEHNMIFAILPHGFSSVLKKNLKTGTKIMTVAMKLKDVCSLKEKI